MIKGNRVKNRSDHEAACPQVFKEFPKKAVAPKKAKRAKKNADVEEVVAEEVVEEEAVEDVGADDDSES